MVNIYLYFTTSEIDKPLKTFSTTYKVHVTGTLRGSCDIRFPVIPIESTVDLSKYNYAYIAELKRLYFIEGYTILSTGLNLVRFKEDVLGTYYYSYKDCYATVVRNETIYDLKLADNMIPYTTKKDVISIPFTNLVTNPLDVTYPLNTKRILIAVLNDSTYSNGNYGILGQTKLGISDTIPNSTIGNSISTVYYVCEIDVAIAFLKSVYANNTYLGFIKHITALPWGTDENNTYHQLTDIRVGNHDVTVTTMTGPFCGVHQYCGEVIEVAKFKIDSSTYDNYLYRTATWQMWLPYVGYIDINFDEIYNNTISVCYVINFDNADTSVIVRDTTNDRIIYTSKCQMGCTIGVSSTNLHEWNVQRNAITNEAITQGLVSAVTGIAGIGLMASGAGFLPGMGMAMSAGGVAAQTATGVYNKDAANYKLGYAKTSSGLNGVVNPQNVSIKCIINTTEHSIDETNYKTLYGLPCYRNDKIVNFSGYTLISKVDLNNIVYSGNSNVSEMSNTICCATREELVELEDLLKSGVRL